LSVGGYQRKEKKETKIQLVTRTFLVYAEKEALAGWSAVLFQAFLLNVRGAESSGAESSDCDLVIFLLCA
jgi:hypothetical protein